MMLIEKVVSEAIGIEAVIAAESLYPQDCYLGAAKFGTQELSLIRSGTERRHLWGKMLVVKERRTVAS